MDFEADVRRQQLELQKLERLQDLDVASAGHDLHAKKRGDLQGVALEKERAGQDISKDELLTRHAADSETQAREQQAELDKLRLQASMDPDQILAVQAGLSPEIAAVFAEKAKAGGADKEALLREMLQMSQQSGAQTTAQAQAMFDKAVDKLAEVGSAAAAAGAAAGAAGGAVSGGAAKGEAECPKCHVMVPVGDRFCKNCGNKMRT